MNSLILPSLLLTAALFVFPLLAQVQPSSFPVPPKLPDAGAVRGCSPEDGVGACDLSGNEVDSCAKTCWPQVYGHPASDWNPVECGVSFIAVPFQPCYAPEGSVSWLTCSDPLHRIACVESPGCLMVISKSKHALSGPKDAMWRGPY